MTTSKKRVVKADQASMTHKLGPGWTQITKTNRIRVQCPKPNGCSEASSSHELGRSEHSAKPTKGVVSENHVDRTHNPSAKIKLQLFPVDEETRLGLEKDGYHPYLELTLSARKKISSVLKHLNKKWGASIITTVEPMLFPYEISENLTKYKWTLNDTGISAEDVYAAIGKPSVFRLRYGWFTDPESKSSEVPLTSTGSVTSLQPDNMKKGSGTSADGIDETDKQIDAPSDTFEPIIAKETTDAMVDKMSSNGLVEPMENEVRTDVGNGQSTALWEDSLTDISIGGLLSEASLQGRMSSYDSKPNGSNAGLQPSELITESLDAFLASQLNTSQGPRQSAHGSSSSILDAENTCHAFLFQKFSCPDKNSVALGRSGCSQAYGQDAGSKSLNYPNTPESGFPQGEGEGCEEPQKDIPLHSQVYNDESSLGLSGIKWTDSLGPFDFGLSFSGRINADESLSKGKDKLFDAL